MTTKLGLGLGLAAALAAGAQAQEQTTNRVAASTDWSVFQETDPVECFSVSAPKEQVNTRDGQPVEVSRSEALLFVFYRPSEGVAGQVTFTGGYPFAPGSAVQLQVGEQTFSLFTGEETAEDPTQDEWAWAATPEEDARIVEAMKGGSEAVLTGQSGRGTVTQDTFSLLGFTAAVDEARTRCPA